MDIYLNLAEAILAEFHNIWFYGELTVLKEKSLQSSCVLCKLYEYGEIHVWLNWFYKIVSGD